MKTHILYDLKYLGEYKFEILDSFDLKRRGDHIYAEAFILRYNDSYQISLNSYKSGYSLPEILCLKDKDELQWISLDGLYIEIEKNELDID